MYRISIEMLPHYWARVDFLLRWAEDFEDLGIVVGANLERPDLRLVHHDIALNEWTEGKGSFKTPLIVYERADQAAILNSTPVRELMAHPNVKFWLKQTTFRDYRLNNEPHVAGYWHYAQLLKYPSLGLSDLPEAKRRADVPATPIDADVYRKVKLLPVIADLRYASLLAMDKVCAPADRNIDVNFAGQVDYQTGDIFLARHRRAAASTIVNLRRLKTLIGINGSLPRDIYMETLNYSKISVSPWGYGEYSWRDYESLLSGCVLVRPNSDHMTAFDPDIFQSNKYYVPCRPDFEDLPNVIQKVLDDFESYHQMALQARRDLLAANTRHAIVEYFLDMFEAARSDESDLQQARRRRVQNREENLSGFLSSRDASVPAIDLRTTSVANTRSSLAFLADDPLVQRGENPVRLSEDSTESNTHDIRLSSSTVASGSYEIVLAVRPAERKSVCLVVHSSWKDQVRIVFDADRMATRIQQETGTTFKPENVRCRDLYMDWKFLKMKLQISNDPADVSICVGLLDDLGKFFYSGDGSSGVDLGVLSLYPRADQPQKE